jgi:hypothetical protein
MVLKNSGPTGPYVMRTDSQPGLGGILSGKRHAPEVPLFRSRLHGGEKGAAVRRDAGVSCSRERQPIVGFAAIDRHEKHLEADGKE